MIVEFIGAPGSGKTTFMPYIRNLLMDQGYTANAFLDAARPFARKTIPGKIISAIIPGKLKRFMLWQIFYVFTKVNRAEFAQKHQTLMDTVLPYQAKRPLSKSDKKHVLRWFVHLTGCYEFFNKYIDSHEVVIFDEGFVHRVVQLFASENEEVDYEAIREYLNMIPKPDLVVFVNASERICQERVFSRGVWDRFREKDRNDTILFIQRAWEIVNFSVKSLREMNWNIVEIQNDHQEIGRIQDHLPQLVLERMEFAL